jgi:hypothetical protein
MIRRIGAALVFVAAFLMLHATVQELDERALEVRMVRE